MARESRKQTEQKSNLMNNRRIRDRFRQLSNILGNVNLNLYGTDRTSDVDNLNQQFQSIMKNELNNIVGKDSSDTSSFLSKIHSMDKKQNAMENLIANQFGVNGHENSATLQSFIQEAYKNRLTEQADLHEVASQLIELSEAILITRDAIVSADVVEGRMSRTLDFQNVDEEDVQDNIALVEHMEKKFDLLSKIKNHIIPKTLEYGEYYAYTIPYSKIFNDFMDKKGSISFSQSRMYHESTVYDSVNRNENADKFFTETSAILQNNSLAKKKESYSKKIYKEYCEAIEERKTGRTKSQVEDDMQTLGILNESIPNEKEFCNDIDHMMKNITVCNDAVPLPIVENGISSMESLNTFLTEATVRRMDSIRVQAPKAAKEEMDSFHKVVTGVTADGVTFANNNDSKQDKDGHHHDFDEFTDCYIKLIEPTRIIPIKIMSETIGYYFLDVDDITPLAGEVSSNLATARFDEHAKEHTIIDSLAEAIVDAFDKPFLKENEPFKKLIAEAILHYNLNDKRIRFQYIPVEYMQDFKIDEDVDGNGTSMILKSLFYAKLYLMLLLFKMMSIILNSNDQKVNYVKTSGIDKDVASKVQQLIRTKQSRQVNMYDLFNYTTLVNKIGMGNEMYVPTGRSGERPVETEILSGQDVQLNTDLMENLKNSYILGTGVPAALINYLNEADFAKVVEQNNTKFNGRVVNYQLDFNASITKWYQKIMSWSTHIPDNLIENFQFTLQPPKTSQSTAKSEAIQSYQSYSDFVVQLIYGDNADGSIDVNEIQHFKKLLADDQLPLLNLQELEKMRDKAKLKATEDKLKPDPAAGDNGDDIGLDLDEGMGAM